eukprot:Skav201410  [mRNA]  locus=scaffold83:5284:7357:+ [translate_table: standard]
MATSHPATQLLASSAAAAMLRWYNDSPSTAKADRLARAAKASCAVLAMLNCSGHKSAYAALAAACTAVHTAQVESPTFGSLRIDDGVPLVDFPAVPIRSLAQTLVNMPQPDCAAWYHDLVQLWRLLDDFLEFDDTCDDFRLWLLDTQVQIDSDVRVFEQYLVHLQTSHAVSTMLSSPPCNSMEEAERLISASIRGLVTIVAGMLERLVDPNITANGCTGLHMALDRQALLGDIQLRELVTLFMDSHGDPNLLARHGASPLSLAIRAKILESTRYDIVDELCNGQANVNAQDGISGDYLTPSTLWPMPKSV